MGERPAKMADRIWANLYGLVWIGAWFAAIWWEPHRTELFWTGALALLLGLLTVSGKDFS